LHLAVAPVGSVLPAGAEGTDFDTEAVDFAAVAAGADGDAAPEGVGVAAGAAAVAAVAFPVVAAAVLLAAFWTPPWPLQAPLPVAAEVVPSLQVVGLVVSAWLGSANANISSGAAKTTKLVFFIKFTPSCDSSRPLKCKPIRVEANLLAAPTAYRVVLSGSSDATLIRKRVYSCAEVASNKEPCTLTCEFSMMFSGNSDTPTSWTSVADMHW